MSGANNEPEKINSFKGLEDKIGITSLKNFITKIDNAVHDKLDELRFDLKSDPTLRNWENRKKQLKGGTLNSLAFFGEQCVNIFRKPIALAYNSLKAVGCAGAALYNIRDKEQRNKHLQTLKSTLIDATKDVGNTLVAGTTLFVAIVSTPFGGPIIGSALGCGVGAALPVVGHGITQAVNVVYNGIWNNVPSAAAQTVYMAAEAKYHQAEYARTSPESNKENHENLSNLHKQVINSELSLAERREANKKLEELHNQLKAENLKKDFVGRQINKVNSIIEKFTKGKTEIHPIPNNSFHSRPDNNISNTL